MVEKGHIVYMLPKFHCKLNPIERVWAQAMKYSKAYCNYTIRGLRNTIHPSLDSVALLNIENHFRKVRLYVCLLGGSSWGSDLEKLVKDYKKSILSDRRISEHQ